jgi:hypothetical protein
VNLFAAASDTSGLDIDFQILNPILLSCRTVLR